MSGPRMRLTVSDFTSGGDTLRLDEPLPRFVYAVDEPPEIAIDGRTEALRVDDGKVFDGALALSGKGWIFELGDAEHGIAGRPGLDPVLSHIIELHFDGPPILRADRVASLPGARTPKHGHRGPGIRRLVTGCIRAEIGDNVERIDAGRAWFETGSDWVVGENVSDGENVFVRVMVLPAELEGGKSSFVPASPEEAARPRAVNYRLFGELRLEPGSAR